jgi:hypothetical protein
VAPWAITLSRVNWGGGDYEKKATSGCTNTLQLTALTLTCYQYHGRVLYSISTSETSGFDTDNSQKKEGRGGDDRSSVDTRSKKEKQPRVNAVFVP